MFGWLEDGFREPLWALRVLAGWALAFWLCVGFLTEVLNDWDRRRGRQMGVWRLRRKIAVVLGGLLLARLFIAWMRTGA